jgi:predicted benzoate:H+ symporter BenE
LLTSQNECVWVVCINYQANVYQTNIWKVTCCNVFSVMLIWHCCQTNVPLVLCWWWPNGCEELWKTLQHF